MKKEQIKSITLTLLVMLNLVLGSNILLDKKLWPYGYNFFNIANFPIIQWFKNKPDEQREFQKIVHLTLPAKIIFNTGDQATRFSVNSNNAEYNTIIEYCNEILGVVLGLPEEKIIGVTSEEWFSSLMSDSIYLNYYTEYDTQLFANFLGLRNTEVFNKVKSFSNVVISLSDNVTVYFEDIESNKYYKIKTGRRFADFKEIADDIVANKDDNVSKEYAINYSFDLNFDKAFGEQKTIIDSMVPIYSNVSKVPVVFSKEVLMNSGNTGINELAKVFNVKANTARRYTEADETIVYVENNATLKIHSNGMIEYKARDNGIQLSNSGGMYNNISKLNEFVGRINSVIGINDSIYLSSKASRDENVITFDYVCEGMPVKINIDDMKNAVYCEISDGYIKEYKHIIKDYEMTGEYFETPEYIYAVDNAIQKYSALTGEIKINKLYLAYNDNGLNDTLSADWNAEVESIIVKDKEE